MTAKINGQEFEAQIREMLDWTAKRVKGEVGGHKDIHEKIAEWKEKAREVSESEV